MKKIIVIIILQSLWLFIVTDTVGENNNNVEYYYDVEYFYDSDPIKVGIDIQNIHNLMKPIIEPHKTEITIDSGTNYTLFCKSQNPINWITNSFKIIDNKTNIYKNDEYTSSLEILNATVKDVGEYFCINSQVKDESENLYKKKIQLLLSSVYVFVDDRRNQLVPMKSNYFMEQYEILLIPCKPSNKSSKVTIVKDEGNSHLVIISSNPMYGLEILALDDQATGYYYCTANNDKKNAFKFHLRILKKNIILKKSDEINIIMKEYSHENKTLEFYCSAPFSNIYNWTLPNNNIATKENRTIYSDHNNILTVFNIDHKKDDGIYSCCTITKYHNFKESYRFQNKLIKIVNDKEKYINIKESIGKYLYDPLTNGLSVNWIIPFDGNDIPILNFFDNNGNKIQNNINSTKYVISIEDKYIKFQINRLYYSDVGIYKMKLSNANILDVELKLILLVKPFVTMNDVEVKSQHEAILVCNITCLSHSKIMWSFTPCTAASKLLDCDDKKIERFNATNLTTISSSMQQAIFKFTPNSPGKVICEANNNVGFDEISANVILKHSDEILEVSRKNSNIPIIIDQSITITCVASAYNTTGEMYWYRDGKLMQNTTNIFLKTNFTTYSYIKEIFFENITEEDSGDYECLTNIINKSSNESKSISIFIDGPLKPRVENLNASKTVYVDDSIQFLCQTIGRPLPKIEWFKNDVSLTIDNKRISLDSEGTILNISPFTESDVGLYKCQASNRLGSHFATKLIEIKHNQYYLLFIGICLILIFITFTYLNIRIKKLKRKSDDLKKFLNGSLEEIDPEQPLDEQVDLLQYNKSFEFPRNCLDLGVTLGTGAFGVVYKGLIKHKDPNKEDRIVAVKTIKGNADNDKFREFISELKIMIYIGENANIVNILGAITKNIDKHEMMIIVEYCEFGSLKNFLFKQREYFIDQINPDTNNIDHTILTKQQIKQKEFIQAQRSGTLKYVQVYDSMEYQSLTSEFQYDQSYSQCSTENNSPTSCHNFIFDIASDYKITTSILINWSVQVAKGMEYLAFKKVLHGDLAARNVLLSENNIVKICDFGLARKMYKDNIYKKKANCPLPFKWLAIESLVDHVFSEHSDVWSFGIFLWELFSLANDPYPGIDCPWQLLNQIQNGFRMKNPKYANTEIYELMLDCWDSEPMERPTFSKLVTRLEEILEVNGLLKINQTYTEMKSDLLNNIDYLPMANKCIQMRRNYVHKENLNLPITGSKDATTIIEKKTNLNSIMNKIKPELEQKSNLHPKMNQKLLAPKSNTNLHVTMNQVISELKKSNRIKQSFVNLNNK